jgi:hypothetical protein
LIHGEDISADLLNASRDSVAMQRTQNIESLQDHQRQSALENFRFLFIGHLGFQQEGCQTSFGKATGK